MVPVECVVRGYITGSGLEGLPVHRRGLRHRAAGRPAASPSSCPEPIFTPATKAELGDHDENVDFDRAAEIVGDRAAARGAAPAVARDLRARRPARARARDHPGGHQVRVRPPRRRDDRARRRGAHPRLLPLLARSTGTSRAVRSRASTSSSCATGPPGRAGTSRRPRRRSRPRWWRAPGRATRRPTSGSPTSPSAPGWSARADDREGAHPAEGGHPRSIRARRWSARSPRSGSTACRT